MIVRKFMSMRLFVIFCLLMIQTLEVAKAQDRPSKIYITGTIVGVGGRFGGQTVPFSLNLGGYSPTAEQQRLNSALKSGGQESLLKALDKNKAGSLSLNNNVGMDVGAIFLKPTETGSKLTIIYERRLALFEVRAGTRSANYPFGYMEIYLDLNGKGEGTMIPAARIRLQKDGNWEVEDFGEFPARLLGVQIRQ